LEDDRDDDDLGGRKSVRFAEDEALDDFQLEVPDF
jgi:hypothetical protein